MGSRNLRIGDALVDLDRQQISVDGAPIPLGGRAFTLLEVLLAHRDRVISKAELIAQVWPTTIVEENNLPTQVVNLRRALAGSTIVNIPGRGYRLIADVQELENLAATQPSILSTGSTSPSRTAQKQLLSTPQMTTPLVGREVALCALAHRLRMSRQCTLLGGGGVGKTALAMSVANAWALGKVMSGAAASDVHWLSLAPIQDSDGVAVALATVLCERANVPDTVLLDPARFDATATEDWRGLLATWSLPSTGLLVLDNGEHLLTALAALLPALLETDGEMRVLVTSQAPLRFPGEEQFMLPPLAVPATGVDLTTARTNGALLLFEQAAQLRDHRFQLDELSLPHAVQICRALNGVPLALQLAAARLPLMGLKGLLTTMDDSLSLTTGGPDPRHHSVRATLDWSYGLLAQDEQRAFRMLCVCRGDTTFPLAGILCAPVSPSLGAQGTPVDSDVAGLDALAELVDRSLVQAICDSDLPTYRLPDTHRLYALGLLEVSGEKDAASRRHALAMQQLMRVAAEDYWRLPDAEWLARNEPDIENLRAALDWCAENDIALAADLLSHSSFLFIQLGRAAEARRRWRGLPESEVSRLGPQASAMFHVVGSRLHWGIDAPRTLALAERARHAFRQLQDRRAWYIALRCSLGSGLHSEHEARELLAEMKRVEDARWPPRLRAQYLLAEMDHLAQAGADNSPTLKQLRTTRETLKRLSLDAGLDTLAVLARIGLADSALLNDTPKIAIQRCRNLLADAPLYGNQRLQVLATLAAAQLAQTQTADARVTLDDFATFCSRRDWEWFDRHADLFTLLATQEGQSALAQAICEYADHAADAAGGRNGPSWQRLYARVQQELASLPAVDPIAEPPCRPVEICRELKLGQLD